MQKFSKKTLELKEKGCRITGIIENNAVSIVTQEIKINCAELFVGDAVKILKGLINVIEQSTHTKYPEEIYCFGSKDFTSQVAKVVKNYEIKLIV